MSDQPCEESHITQILSYILMTRVVNGVKHAAKHRYGNQGCSLFSFLFF